MFRPLAFRQLVSKVTVKIRDDAVCILKAGYSNNSHFISWCRLLGERPCGVGIMLNERNFWFTFVLKREAFLVSDYVNKLYDRLIRLMLCFQLISFLNLVLFWVCTDHLKFVLLTETFLGFKSKRGHFSAFFFSWGGTFWCSPLTLKGVLM